MVTSLCLLTCHLHIFMGTVNYLTPDDPAQASIFVYLIQRHFLSSDSFSECHVTDQEISFLVFSLEVQVTTGSLNLILTQLSHMLLKSL